MQHVIHALRSALRERQIGEVAFEELDARNVIEIAPVAGDEAVGDADAVAAADEFFREMRADEPGAAGDEVRSHSVEVPSQEALPQPRIGPSWRSVPPMASQLQNREKDRSEP